LRLTLATGLLDQAVPPLHMHANVLHCHGNDNITFIDNFIGVFRDSDVDIIITNDKLVDVNFGGRNIYDATSFVCDCIDCIFHKRNTSGNWCGADKCNSR
jgi:hypothetical protein